MLFLVWGVQKVFHALLAGWKALSRCRWSWRRLCCVPPPPPPPSYGVRAMVTAALNDPRWARLASALRGPVRFPVVLCLSTAVVALQHSQSARLGGAPAHPQ